MKSSFTRITLLALGAMALLIGRDFTYGERPGSLSPDVTAHRERMDGRVTDQHADIHFTGVITYLDGSVIRLNGSEHSLARPEEMSFRVTPRTEVTVSGTPAKLKDLLPGMTATVTAEPQTQNAVAKRIDASPLL
jgi:hypothetical protein